MLWRQVWKEDNGKLFAPLVESHFSNDIEGKNYYNNCMCYEAVTQLKEDVNLKSNSRSDLQRRYYFLNPFSALRYFDLLCSWFCFFFIGATAQSIWDRILSKSYISCLSTEQQAALKKRVDQILKEKLPQFAQNFDEAKVLYPYTTDVVIAQKLPLSNN